MAEQFNQYYDFRSRLVAAVTRDLVGPTAVEDEEVIQDPPFTKYICGVLYPQSSNVIDEEMDNDASSDDEDDEAAYADPPVAMAHVRYPSSLGVSFAVDPAATQMLNVHVTCARYLPSLAGDVENQRDGDRGRARRVRQGSWRRSPQKIEAASVEIVRPFSKVVKELAPGLELFARVRSVDEHGRIPVTIVVVNTLKLDKNEFIRDAKSFFQVQVKVRTPQSSSVFVERPDAKLRVTDEDLRMYRLLYRNARTFAIGHGCSANWTIDQTDESRANEVCSETIPQFNLRLSDTNEELPDYPMRLLSRGTREEVFKCLEDLCSRYDGWLELNIDASKKLPDDLRAIAGPQLDDKTGCGAALKRMRDGIEALRTDDFAWQAFQLANEAMLEQRARTVWLKNGKPSVGPLYDNTHGWRPFQIGFFLLCIRGLADVQSGDRELADLLWFPTGGGKTEAYLGLIAFTIFLRRLRKPTCAGVTALMRYTLRLLTIQQFERACLLICCCENIRSHRKDLGVERISIGLWVGQKATPNTCEQARKALDLIKDGQTVEMQNPMQLQSCPWCGSSLGPDNYHFRKGAAPCVVIACGERSCDFRTGLPAYVVDDCIYTLRPSLLISTVDKFASLPWVEETANLFNLNSSEERPPDLIIQDELHLISGPLGTLTGLYETAIDFICSQHGVRPKIIASTATIRRAASQIKGLFNREVRQFPPPAIDGRDSFFAREATPDKKGTRLYVGVMAPGTSHATLLVRSYAALLQFCHDLPGADSVKDPYWTLVGYFNSLRVLGSAKLQVQDDVTDRITLLAAEAGTEERSLAEDRQIELSSRIISTDIPESLRRMAISLPSLDALNVILATNMISVGMDINRLGLMTVMGQPQATSEYIQATSRVGRAFPGLVLVLFNSARSRDRSHYESFVSYHGALYRQVESTSVTPFSSRARDRALHAVLVTMARLCLVRFRSNQSASDTGNLEETLGEFVDAICARVMAISGGEAERTRAQLLELIRKWRAESVTVKNLVFRDFRNPGRALLVSAEDDAAAGENKFATLWSLRDVDASSDLYLVM